MSSIERLISTKVYEWKRRRLRTENRKQKYQGQLEMKVTDHKKPQVLGFRVNATEKIPIEQRTISSKRMKKYRQAQLKKLIGIGLISIGVLLLLTRCFANKTEETLPEEALPEEVAIEVTVEEMEMPIQIMYGHYIC